MQGLPVPEREFAAKDNPASIPNLWRIKHLEVPRMNALTLALMGMPARVSADVSPTPFSLTAAAPCNLFALGEPLVFAGAAGDTRQIRYVVRDYDGATVCEGGGIGRLNLPAQPPGYYELEWRTAEGEGKVPFGVIPARPDEPPPDGPLNVDGATAWLCGAEQWEPVARMLRRVGVGWMRERLSWGAVNREEGKIDWERYETVADILQAQGVREYQIFHDSPGWTHPGRETRCPDDLRTVYRFTKGAAAHYRGRILAWEPWNEPDIDFFDQLGDKYAGVQKAAYLGLKAGAPDVPVLSCSFCRGRSGFSDNVFESGVADYCDIFNFHTYAPIGQYADSLAAWLSLPEEYAIGDRPVWLTEAGVRLEHTDKELTAERERAQAEFVPRSFAVSLAAGVDKHFFFVLPFYPEGPIQFGALHKDLSPRPAMLAIATAVRVLGEARYLGKLAADPVQGHVFANGEQRVAVVWAEQPTELRLQTNMRSVGVVDLIGREHQAQTEGGVLTLAVGPAAQYVVGLADPLPELSGTPRPRGKLPSLDPSKVVLVGYPEHSKLDKGSNTHQVAGGEPIPFVADVYNFDEAAPTQGSVSLGLPAGWAAEPARAEVALEALGRQTVQFALTPAVPDPAARGPAKVKVVGDFPGPKVAPSVSYLRVDLASLKPTRTLDLKLNGVEAWQANISGNGKMTIEPGPDGGVAFPITFEGTADRWCYPRAEFAEVQDWREYHAIAFEYRFDTDDKATSARVQVIESGGSSYLAGGHPATKAWQRAVILLAEMGWGTFSAADPDGKLDLDGIGSILIGCNTQGVDKLTLEVRNVELLAYD